MRTNTVINTITDSVNNISNQTTEHEFLIYPNPTSPVIWVRSDYVKNISGYSIYDLTGRKLISNELKTPEIDVSSLTNGIYFIEVVNKNGRKQIGKFVKN